ncbi:MAG: cytochrome c oxidase accessory protein CcoG [Thioalkalispiraceae bacterium]|jgi:cytochrome c oxidase accessory protein FixG
MSEEFKQHEQLYQSRIEIFPRSVKGRFRNLKYAVLALAYGVYFLLPWLRWERASGPDQAVLFDIVHRRFYLFDLTVYAQDIFWLAGFLVIAAFLLFFVTGIAGRVFCGYFCFQTLWTDVFMLIERLVQGDRNARIKLHQGPWTSEKKIKMGMTHLLWLLVAFLTGLSFTLYWDNAPELVKQFVSGEAPFAAYATTLFLTLTTYVMAGMAREQVCTYMCPYARFQGVMFDEDTLVVTYDAARGEREQGRQKPRKGLLKQDERIAAGVGDCIDCGYCVQVCPTGIDIRNGLQYQCISCALCIDACDTIMDSINYPRGLIRYSSERAMQGKKTRSFKPKNLGYGFAVLLTIGALVWSITTRSSVELLVRQIRQPLAVTLSDGSIQNRYQVKINNKTATTMIYRLDIKDLPGASLDMGRKNEIRLLPQQSSLVYIKVKMQPQKAQRSQQAFEFVLNPVGDAKLETIEHSAVFYIPQSKIKGNP